MSNTALRLPFLFDVPAMLKELDTALQQDWAKHYNKADYHGEWTSVSLRSMSGKEDDARAQAGAGYRNTPLLEKLPYLGSVVAQFRCPLETVRLLRLAPGSEIKEHSDPDGGYPDGYLRIHVPIRTSDAVDFIVDGERIPMQPGECWYADFSLPHRVLNRSTEDRIHLVIDGVRNAWTDELMRNAGYDFETERTNRQPDPATLQKTIDELRLQGTETANALADQLEQQLHSPARS